MMTLKLLKEISDDMKENKHPRQNHPLPKPTRKRKRKRADTSKYCWSCGAWNHKFVTCRFKKTGHQDNATFENKMSGSTSHCPAQWNGGPDGKLSVINKLAKQLNLLNTFSSDSPHHNYKTIVAKADSAATNHYWRTEDLACLSNIKPYTGPSVTLPNNTQIAPSK